MERETLALSALLQRNSPAHGLVKLPPFASSYEISKNKKKIDKWNGCLIDFYLLIDTVDINQIGFIDWQLDTDFIDWLLQGSQSENLHI